MRPVDASLLVSVDPEPSVDSNESSRGLGSSGDREVRRKEVLDSSEERIDELRRSEEDEVVGENLEIRKRMIGDRGGQKQG